ncbi:BTB/POZ domain-containing protein At5g66560-like [Arachis stenosperma]|uniref:BTB/POZ domain-containing protein At5g66560-like n=1 Tax=Arachis stenosperma TaxID=217475 RepID=UPI0025AC66CE|nr:BTB/POZ domain-containing protein At5g66560-like [Arachis stenosperma]
MATEKKLSSKGQAWFCTTGLPSDIVVEVDDMNFHLHKFPLMSKSRKLHQLITEQEAKHSSAARPEEAQSEDEEEDQILEQHFQLTFTEFPGGSEAFELAAKFCYGVKIDLSPSNVASLRCAGEFLEMTEEYSEDNLISKTERFLSSSVLNSIKDSITTLKSCERLMPMAEELGIASRCIDSIVSRASSADPALFGWPVNDAGADSIAAASGSASKQAMWNGIETAARRRRNGVIRGGGVTGGGAGGSGSGGYSWFEEISLLGMPLFKQLILAMKEAEMNSEITESCLMHYAKKHIPGVSRSIRKPLPSSSSSSSSLATEAEQKDLLETIVSNLPLEKSSKPSTATRFLFGLLRTANILNASEDCRDVLEKKIGSQLEEATLDDLLIPSYSYLNETLYDVDCVERILGHFLDGIEHRSASEIDGGDSVPRSPALMLVGKLIDGYLSEIASDSNLKASKFYNLAISLPDEARLFDDGLYRAVDVYLKAHPWVSEQEREKICGVLDCRKLTLEACTHAAQNERLPLRAVVQVLFFEQLQLRQAIAGTLMATAEPGRPSVAAAALVERGSFGGVEEAGEGNRVGSDTWRVAVRDNQVLRLDMDSMRTRVHQLERECSSMRKTIEKMGQAGLQEEGVWWDPFALGRKFGCKFKTHVCDSHGPTAIDKGTSRPNQLQPHRPRRE